LSALAPPGGAGERHQREDAALSIVVSAHHQEHVLRLDHDEQRPDDERDQAEHLLRVWRVSHRPHGFAQGVERARSDVAEHDAQGCQGTCARTNSPGSVLDGHLRQCDETRKAAAGSNEGPLHARTFSAAPERELSAEGEWRL
jgi:hypothetical protein